MTRNWSLIVIRCYDFVFFIAKSIMLLFTYPRCITRACMASPFVGWLSNNARVLQDNSQSYMKKSSFLKPGSQHYKEAPYGFLKSVKMQISTWKTETKVRNWITFRAVCVCCYDNSEVSKWPKIYIQSNLFRKRVPCPLIFFAFKPFLTFK